LPSGQALISVLVWNYTYPTLPNYQKLKLQAREQQTIGLWQVQQVLDQRLDQWRRRPQDATKTMCPDERL